MQLLPTAPELENDVVEKDGRVEQEGESGDDQKGKYVAHEKVNPLPACT